jgi:NADH dehydrogenase
VWDAGKHPHVVILGGGFGGLYAAFALQSAPVRLSLIDRRNHHVFQPLLYQVATAGLNPSDIAEPIRSILRRQRNASVLLAEARAVDLAARRVQLDAGGEIQYDFLIVATGVTHSYFGHEQWAAHAPGLKSIEDALEIRRRVFSAYEAAEREPDPQRRSAYLSFVIVGAGPTGVELAGALAEISRHALSDEFRRFDPREARVMLLEGADRVLPPYPPRLSQKAQAQLERLGVEVRTGAHVTQIDAAGLWLGQERLEAATVLWAAGIQASPLARSLGVPLDPAGRVRVERDLTLAGHPEVFVIGDLAAIEQGGRPVPGVAPAAMQQGRYAARAIVRALRGEPREAFRYVDKGSFATIGRGAAVGEMRGRLQIWGFSAWLAWLAIHIYFLIGFRNRALVMFHWAYSYLTYRRGARLILPSQGSALPPAPRSLRPPRE